MTETEACIALNMVPRMGPVRMRKLLARFGSPSKILHAPAAALQEADGVGGEAARSIANWKETVALEEELARIEKAGVRVLTWADDDYPEMLREIHDPPIALYMLGSLTARHRHAIGVVGTRKPTHYATDCAKKLSYQLATAGITVVSGLARGVDTFAHQAALAAKGRTIAVIGSGLGRLYPPENRELASRIAAEGGAVLSEFPMLTGADKQTFPMRNRIISGLSFGLLVVEAGVRSGALISANQAGDQGRSIYAVPGRIDNPNALGSNRLIQQGAKLLLSASDILDDLGVLFPQKPELAPPSLPEGLGRPETSILEALQTDELTVDEIIAKSGLLPHEVSASLLALEIRGLVRNLPGSRFVRLT
jgi:DNA processing protein